MRTLEVRLITTSENTFDVEIHEAESGDFVRIHCHDKGDSVDEENKKIAEEIRSWIGIMREGEEEGE